MYGELYTTYNEVTYKIDRKTEKTASEIHYSKIGDVIIPTSGETPEEIATATCVMIPGVILAGDLNIYRTNIIDGRIVSFIINHVINNKISKVAQGKSVVHVKAEEIGKISINYPNAKEQKKILSFLELLDKKIDKQKQLVESLKSYKRGAFLELYKNMAKRTVFFKEIYLKAAEGGTPSTAISEYYYNGTIPFAKIEDLSQRYLFCTKSFITERGLYNSSAWLIPQGSVIFSNGATIGACSINKIDIATKQGILGIVPQEDYSSEYLYHFFTSKIFRKKVKAVTTKGTMDCVYLKDLDYIKIEMPEYNEQLRIGSILNKIEDILEKNVTILQKLQCIKNGLLQQLFI